MSSTPASADTAAAPEPSSRLPPAHPWILAAGAALLAARRSVSPSASDGLAALAAALGATGLLWLALRPFLRDAPRRAVLLSAWLALAFSHGLELARRTATLGSFSPMARAAVLLGALALLGLAAAWAVARARSLRRLSRGLDVAALLLAAGAALHSLRGAPPGSADGEAPDIYYVVLDTYGSSRTLADVYHFDDEELISFLRDRGFYVATESVSNYPITFNSLASSLNMEYVNYLEEELGPASVDWEATARLVRTSAVMRALKTAGYRIVTFDSGWEPTRRSEVADRVVHPCWADSALLSLVEMTPLSFFWRDLERRSARVRCIFEELGRIDDGAPLFVFAHLTVPHPPFLFGPNGEWRDPAGVPFDGGEGETYRQGYRDAVSFVNGRLRASVDRILVRAGGRAIVVIQGDHGPASSPEWKSPGIGFQRERFGILSAYRVPASIESRLYPSITPVNTFRLLLGRGAGGPHPLLPDRSFFCTYERPYSFREVTAELRSPHPPAARR